MARLAIYPLGRVPSLSDVYRFPRSDAAVAVANSRLFESQGGSTLTPALFTNAQVFYSPSVAVASTLTPALFTNAQVFYSPSITATSTLTPALFTNAQVFYSATVAQIRTLTPALFTNTQVFYSPTVDQTPTIIPQLLVNLQTFFPFLVKRGLAPPNWTTVPGANSESYSAGEYSPALGYAPVPAAGEAPFHSEGSAPTPNFTKVPEATGTSYTPT